VIEPAFAWFDRSTFEGPSTRRVPDDFRYSSDSNPDWLKPEQIRTMLTDKD
jgi:hypothetical protein